MSNRSRIPSPSRSEPSNTPRRHRSSRLHSMGSPARTSTRASSLAEQFKENQMRSFVMSPLHLKWSILSDNTDIEEPRRRQSWWKKLENSRDVAEVLDQINIVNEDKNLEDVIDYEISPEKKEYSINLPETSDESVRSIVVPQRKLLTQKQNHPKNTNPSLFNELIGTRESLAKLNETNIEGQSRIINAGPKNLFNRAPKQRNIPTFPAALLQISLDKTVNKTKELAVTEVKGKVRNLFGNRPENKPKNMFADFIMSESEDEIPEIQPRVFGFQKKIEQKRRRSSVSLGKRGADSSPMSSVIDEMDDWRLLPSSTMVENQLEEVITNNTPVKKPKLSKLLEDKESENLTNSNTTMSKTKQLCKSVSSKNKSKCIDISNEKVLDMDKSVSENQNTSKLSNRSKNKSNISSSYESNKQNRSISTKSRCITPPNSKDVDETEQKQIVAQTKVNQTTSEIKITINNLESSTIKNMTLHKNKSIHLSKGQNIDQTEINQDLNIINKHEDEKCETACPIKQFIRNHDTKCEEIEMVNDTNENIKKTDKINVSKSINNQNGKDESVLKQRKIDNANELDQITERPEIESHSNKQQKMLESINQEQKVSRNIPEKVEAINHKTEANNHHEEIKVRNAQEIIACNDNIEINHDKEESQVIEDENENEQHESSVQQSSVDQNKPYDQENDNEGEELEENLDEEDQVKENNDEEDKIDENIEDNEYEEENDNDNDEEINECNRNIHNNQELQMQSQNEIEPSDQEMNEQESSNATHGNTDKDKKKQESNIKSPEVILHNVTNKNDSFTIHGRDTSVRKSKSMIIKNISIRQSLAPLGENTSVGSDGTKNSSAEGSGWDSHRTTRKTLRQTFGKDFTPRKSLRTLVMEKSAKRQTAINEAKLAEAVKISHDNSPNADKLLSQEKELTVENKISHDKVMSDVEFGEQEMEKQDISQEKQRSREDITQEKQKSHANEHDSSQGRDLTDVNDISRENEKAIENENDISQDKEMLFDIDISQEKSDEEQSDNIENIEMADEDEADISHEKQMSDEDDVNISQEKEMSDEDEVNMSQEKEVSDEDEVDMSQEKEMSDEDEVDMSQEKEVSDEDDVNISQEKEMSDEDEVDMSQEKELSDVDGADISREKEMSDEDEADISQEKEVSDEAEDDISNEKEVSDEDISQENGISDVGDIDTSQDKHISDEGEADISQEKEMSCDDDGEQLSDDDYPQENNNGTTYHRTINDLHVETIKFPQANSTELPGNMTNHVDYESTIEESDHEMSRRTRQTTLDMYIQKIKKENMEKRLKIEEAVRSSLKAPSKNVLHDFVVPMKPAPRRVNVKPIQSKPKKPVKLVIPLEALPQELLEDMKYKPPKRFRPTNAPWITKRLYKFLESKLEPKYDYKARVRAEKLIETIYDFTKVVRRSDVAPRAAVDALKAEMARLRVVTTHFEFYRFFSEYMPREIRVKVNPDVVNKIPLPKRGVFSDILQNTTHV